MLLNEIKPVKTVQQFCQRRRFVKRHLGPNGIVNTIYIVAGSDILQKTNSTHEGENGHES